MQIKYSPLRTHRKDQRRGKRWVVPNRFFSHTTSVSFLSYLTKVKAQIILSLSQYIMVLCNISPMIFIFFQRKRERDKEGAGREGGRANIYLHLNTNFIHQSSRYSAYTLTRVDGCPNQKNHTELQQQREVVLFHTHTYFRYSILI